MVSNSSLALALAKRLDKITFSRHQNICIRPVFSKVPSKQPKKFPSTANNDTKSTLQHTSNIERPDHTTMFTMNLTSTKPAIFCRKIVVQ